MPPLARTIGLLLIVAGPAALAAQTYSAPAAPFPGPAPEIARQRAAERTEVVPAAHQAPLPPGDHPAPSGEAAPGQQGKGNAGAPPAAAGREAPLPLPPPGSNNRGEAGNRAGGLPSAITVAASLAVVLGIFFLIAWAMRRTAPPGLTPLPGEVLEVLGRAPLAGRQQVYLLRCGTKLLLVSVTPTGAETLTEIIDPMEVDRLSGLCHEARPNSATAAFRRVFQRFARQQPPPGSTADGEEGIRQPSAALRGSNQGFEDYHA
jgi:flagellar biogenesis protein FliO